ncbi:Ribonucleases P/MRP protein subunit pop1 [Pseudogymnoascus australis]
MAPGDTPKPNQAPGKPIKRKDGHQNPNHKPNTSRVPKRQKTFHARQILTQASDPSLSAGELNLASFLKAREFEISALEDGMRRAKGALTQRAFQQVPWEMRRRTASHNAKRVPKRLARRAKREMKEDNTPTVVARRRRPGTARGRVRKEGLARMRMLVAATRAKKEGKKKGDGADITDGVLGRKARPKAATGTLKRPPRPASKFRKRQIHKSWLPTHMYHAKRATMTAPGDPLWRFALPITPTQKCYRPTHRAGGERGALAWDMSYMSTIGVEGTAEALERVLKALDVDFDEKKTARRKQIGPATIIWCPAPPAAAAEEIQTDTSKKVKKSPRRRLFIRIHPAAFLELWDEVLRVSKMQYPIVHVEDLRFDIGSIELTGPSSTEALIGTLHRFDEKVVEHGSVFKALAGVTNPASLPPNALLSFSILDPRLRYPPRKIDLPKPNDEEAAFALLQTLATWPADNLPPSPSLFDRDARHKATRLPSQKALNRRKSLALPGVFASLSPNDPAIPILLYPSRTSASSSAQGTWALLAPWKCISAIWYPLLHFPLSCGGNPRFAGLQELRQIQFERGVPWFPGDFPGTNAGWAWEEKERTKRKKEWDARPKGKKVSWKTLDLGASRVGEIGVGWACDFERLMGLEAQDEMDDVKATMSTDKQADAVPETKTKSAPVQQIDSKGFEALLADPMLQIPSASVATVRVTLFSRGVPQPCSRIYRLPIISPTPTEMAPNDQATSSTAITTTPPSSTSTTPADIRASWLTLVPPTTKKPGKPKPTNPRAAKLPPTATPADRSRALAQELVQTPPLPYPPPVPERAHPLVPGEEDLIGFVTTGNFNLAAGAGTGVGALGVERIVGGVRGGGKWKGTRGERLCVVRGAGESVGRLGWWEVV